MSLRWQFVCSTCPQSVALAWRSLEDCCDPSAPSFRYTGIAGLNGHFVLPRGLQGRREPSHRCKAAAPHRDSFCSAERRLLPRGQPWPPASGRARRERDPRSDHPAGCRSTAACSIAVVGPLVEQLAATGKLWIYGEVVELFAEQEDFAGAIRLEELWNGLAAKIPFTLLCGYSSAHFAPPSAKHALRDICGTHTHSAATAADTLGQWLLRRQMSPCSPRSRTKTARTYKRANPMRSTLACDFEAGWVVTTAMSHPRSAAARSRS